MELTRDFQTTQTLEQVVAGWKHGQVVALFGVAGSGKSAVVAALTRPEVAPDTIPPGFMHAVAFAATSPTLVAIAEMLAQQLERLPGFAEASERYTARFDETALGRQDAMTRLLVGPLGALTVTGPKRVRIAVDALDQMDAAARAVLSEAVKAMIEDSNLTGVRVLLTGRPGSLPDFGREQLRIDMSQAPAEEVIAYLVRRGPDQGLVRAIAAQTHTWLDAKVLADLATSVGPVDAPPEGVSLADLYERAITAAQIRVQDDKLLAAALAILAAAGTGPILPLGILDDALGVLEHPATAAQARDLLVGLDGLVVRAKPGTSEETIGLAHETLRDHLVCAAEDGRRSPRRGHEAILSVLERDMNGTAAAYSGYVKLAFAQHLWAVGRQIDAVKRVGRSLGHRPADNVTVLRAWLERAFAELGEDDLATLIIRNDLASWIGEAGDAAGARDAFAALLPDMARVLGADDPDTLAARNNQASWIGEAGNAAGARDAFAALLPDLERVLPPDHPDTFAARNKPGLLDRAGREPCWGAGGVRSPADRL
ncbi:tetratricopeptide repeat protein [Intrasporangium oryzae]|uniref:tetratricopeptide repeat protein n=1 Tax=Intrasporangium oryzae TaxID=412687 RepID=UPI0004BA7E79|nr:tetratricopeptide repeat protein [Intrasporangium oryzae]